jgi:hypothetical protein
MLIGIIVPLLEDSESSLLGGGTPSDKFSVSSAISLYFYFNEDYYITFLGFYCTILVN